jgi:hypothetical protein
MGRIFWAVLFWFWGFGGLIYLFIGIQAEADDLGTRELFWIGGMLLFGISALMSQPRGSSD